MDRIYKDIKLNQVADFSCEGCCLKRNIEDNGKLVANSTHICGLSKTIRWQGMDYADCQEYYDIKIGAYMFKSDLFVGLCSGEFSGNIMYNNESTRLMDNYNMVLMLFIMLLFFLK